MRAIAFVSVLILVAGCGDDAGYSSDRDPQDDSLLIGAWLAEDGGRTVALDIDDGLHMRATVRDGGAEQTLEFDLIEQDGDLVLLDRARVNADLIEERRSVQSYFVDFELFLPLALRKTDATEHVEGVYLARDDLQVDLDGELVLKERTEVVLMLDADGGWVRTSTASRFFEYDDAGEVRFLEPPLVVESQTQGAWQDPGDRQLRLIESTGAYDVTVPLRNGHLPSDDIFWRQPN